MSGSSFWIVAASSCRRGLSSRLRSSVRTSRMLYCATVSSCGPLWPCLASLRTMSSPARHRVQPPAGPAAATRRTRPRLLRGCSGSTRRRRTARAWRRAQPAATANRLRSTRRGSPRPSPDRSPRRRRSRRSGGRRAGRTSPPRTSSSTPPLVPRWWDPRAGARAPTVADRRPSSPAPPGGPRRSRPARGW